MRDYGFLKLFVHVLVSPFKTQARLEAEIVLLRHQLNVLRRRVPSKSKTYDGRSTALRLAPSLFSVGVERHYHCPARDDHPVASDRLRCYWPLEVALSWRRPKVSAEIRRLIRGDEAWPTGCGCAAHPMASCGSSRSKSPSRPSPNSWRGGGEGPSPTWKTFLHNHAAGIAAMDS